MLKNFFRQITNLDARSTPRHVASKLTQCLVTKTSLSPSREQVYLSDIQVYLSDISTDGLSFFFKNPWFEIDDGVRIALIKDSQTVVVSGTIVSQRIFYPEGQQDLKWALYRYSIKFSSSLDFASVDLFKSVDRPA